MKYILLAALALSKPAAASPTIDRLAAKYGLDAKVVRAIVAQESSGRMITTHKKGKVFDIGLMQLNYHTAKAYGFSIGRLMFDPDYNLEAGVIVLADKMRLCSKRLIPWACYHSTTPKRYRKYVTAVSRHFK